MCGATRPPACTHTQVCHVTGRLAPHARVSREGVGAAESSGSKGSAGEGVDVTPQCTHACCMAEPYIKSFVRYDCGWAESTTLHGARSRTCCLRARRRSGRSSSSASPLPLLPSDAEPPAVSAPYGGDKLLMHPRQLTRKRRHPACMLLPTAC